MTRDVGHGTWDMGREMQTMRGGEETRSGLTVSRKWLISMSWEPAVPEVRLTAQPNVWLVTSAMGSARACSVCFRDLPSIDIEH